MLGQQEREPVLASDWQLKMSGTAVLSKCSKKAGRQTGNMAADLALEIGLASCTIFLFLLL